MLTVLIGTRCKPCEQGHIHTAVREVKPTRGLARVRVPDSSRIPFLLRYWWSRLLISFRVTSAFLQSYGMEYEFSLRFTLHSKLGRRTPTLPDFLSPPGCTCVISTSVMPNPESENPSHAVTSSLLSGHEFQRIRSIFEPIWIHLYHK